ncbi:MAG: cysteine--tRNA ligase [Eubacteriales bacterium]|jgi:cysteinyl-tRNA synthetase
MQIYNSYTRKKEELVPVEPGVICMYTCGPTVYHYAHIGNLRTYITEDVLEKYLAYSGYEVRRVMNITDVGHLTSDADTGEDKMLRGARREKKSVMEIARFYTDAFFADCEKLGIKKPEVVVPATSCIDEFIRVISVLLDKGYAYLSGGNVYFDISRLDEYHVFHDFREEDLAVGVREGVGEDKNKRNHADFALWFTKSKFEDQELKWDSPWGVGYPGWHIECSCIAMKYLGERLDIHCGGIDNAFPHHTNEIAQSEAYLGHKWCNFWVHGAHLVYAAGKMSKSSGEFLTLSLLEEKGYNPLAYRFFCLGSHYRKSLVFSWENLDNARTAYNKLVSRISALVPEKGGKVDKGAYEALKSGFVAALENDLNTSLAITAVYDVLKSDTNPATKLALINDFDRVLSLDLVEAAERLCAEERTAAVKGAEVDDPFVAEILKLIAERAEAKKARDYALADRIRAELADRGVILTDTPAGTTYRITKP